MQSGYVLNRVGLGNVAGKIAGHSLPQRLTQRNPIVRDDRKRNPRLRRWNQGQGLVEFALLLPIITLVLMGAVDFGRLYFSYVAVSNASRVGAEYGMDPRRTQADIKTAIKQECPALNLTDADITLASNPSWSAGSELTVSVRGQFQAFTPMISALWGGGTLTLTGRTVARFNSP